MNTKLRLLKYCFVLDCLAVVTLIPGIFSSFKLQLAGFLHQFHIESILNQHRHRLHMCGLNKVNTYIISKFGMPKPSCHV